MTKLWPLVGLSLVALAAPALHAQTVSVDHQSLNFTAQVSGAPTSLPVNVTSVPSAAVILTTVVEQTDPGVTWLSVSPTGGQTPVGLAVTVNPSALSVGTYNGSIVISVFGGSSSVTVAVTLTVTSILVTPTSLTFEASVGNTPLVQSVTMGAVQSTTYTATAATTSGGNWLDVSPPSGLISGYTAVTAIPDATIVPALSPGTYNGTITITPTSGLSQTPVIITVTLIITPAPAVTANPAAVNLQYQVGGTANNPLEVVTLGTPSTEAIAFTAAASNQPTPIGGTWVVVSPQNGSVTSAGTPLSISYNSAANLPTGTWIGSVTVNTPTGAPATTTIPVNLVISTLPLLNVPGATVSFSAELNGSSPAAQSVNITSTSGIITYAVSSSTTDGNPWLVAPTSGTTPGPLSFTVNPTGLAPGTYNGIVTVSAAGTGNGAQQIPVTLTVADDPSLVSNFAAMALPYQLGQTQTVSQNISLTSSTGAPLNFTATGAASSCGSSWLALGGTTGTTPGTITVGVNPAGLSAAGVCTGTVTITATNVVTGAAALNSPLTIPITVTVSSGSASPLLLVAPLTPAVFTAQVGGSTVGPQIFTLTSSTPGDVLNFTVSSTMLNGSGNWLETSQSTGNTGTGFNSLGISVQPGQLTAGTYSGTVTIAATGPGGIAVPNSPLTIPVTLHVVVGSLGLNQSSLTFQQAVGGAAPVNQVVNITSTLQPLGFAASAYSGSAGWLSVSPSGTTPGSISVGVNGAGLALGTYTGTVTVVSTTPNAGNSPVSIAVTLVVNAGFISASPTSLTFTQAQGGSPPAAQTINVSGIPGAISFQDTAGSSNGGTWLNVSPSSGATPATLQVVVSSNSLAVGTYSGAVTINAANAGGSPLTVPVTLNVVTQHNLSVSPNAVTFVAQPGSTTAQSASVQLTSASGSTVYTVAVAGGNWLTASTASGSTPDTITITADPTGLAANAYSGTVTFSSPNAVSSVAVAVNLVVGVVPAPSVNAIANAASYFTGAIAPGENIVIFGSGIGPPSLTKGTVTNGIVDTILSGTRVLFDGIPAPLIYALSTQTSVMVPYELAGRSTASVVVEYQGVQSQPISYSVVVAAPGIYSQNSQGTGPGAILNQNYSINLPGTPAPKGSVIAVYMTGEGDIPGAVDGAIATGTLSPVSPVTATVGGIPATVYYVGTSPGIVTGATQVNILIPATAPSGSAVPLVISVGTGTTAVTTQIGITLSVQ